MSDGTDQIGTLHTDSDLGHVHTNASFINSRNGEPLLPDTSDPHVREDLERSKAALMQTRSIVIPRAADVVRPRRQLDVSCVIEDIHAGSEAVKLNVAGLIDSGATGSCLDEAFASACSLQRKELKHPITLYNADGSKNLMGQMTHFVEVMVNIGGNHREARALPLAKLGSHSLFLGHDWLEYHNPLIDWRKGLIAFSRCPNGGNDCRITSPPSVIDPPYTESEDDATAPIDDFSTLGIPDSAHYSPTRRLERQLNALWHEQGFEEGDQIYAFDLETYLADQVDHAQVLRNVYEGTLAASEDQQRRELFEKTVPLAYKDHFDIFSAGSFNQLPPSRPWDHAIELTKDFKPVRAKVYPLTKAEQDELEIFIKENLATGRIVPSKSPMSSSFFFVKKASGGLRPVQDYRKLNEFTVKNRYPLPLIQTLIDHTAQATIFSIMDVEKAFNNILLRPEDRWKAAFTTPLGQFEPTVMFFGLTNSPSTFQMMMDSIFHDLIIAKKVLIYLDDILVCSKTLEDHEATILEVFKRLREHDLSLNLKKCKFHQSELKFLGVIVGGGQVRMDPSKVAAVTEWPTPTKRKELQSFLGFCNFYRRFIRDFSHVARPLHDLTKRDVSFSWGVAEQSAFDTLKEMIATEPVLILPSQDDPFRVEADASDHALGGVLEQQVDGKWRPVAFLSKSLNPAERNYEIYDKELLAIMTCLEEWRPYLLGTVQPFEIWTDHQNLTYFREARKLNRRQARWFTELQDYNFALLHRPGRTMGKPDGLSRQRSLDDRNDNKDVVLLTPERFRVLLRVTELDLEGPDSDLWKRIISLSSNREQSVSNALAGKDKRYFETEDGVVFYKDLIYVPPDPALREEILRTRHDLPMVSHPGVWKMKNLVLRDFWWPNLSTLR